MISNRSQFASLLDAASLAEPSDSLPAVILVQTGQEAIHVSRAEFQRQSYAAVAAIRAEGMRPGDLLIIAHDDILKTMYVFWGALIAGVMPSIFPTLTEKLDPDIYMERMAQLVSLSDVRAIFTSAAFAPTLTEHVTCPVWSEFAISQFVPDTAPQPQGPATESIAFLQHSSGTTGLQKGVALSHTAVLNQIASYSEDLQLSTTDVVVSWLPLYHDMGLIAGFLLPIFQGVPLVIMSPFDWVSNPALLFKAIDRYGGTLCWLPNFAYNHCARRIRSADLEGLSLHSMRSFINCSEPVHYASHKLFLDRFNDLGVTDDKLGVSYAMAENVFAVTQTPTGQSASVDWIDRQMLITQQHASPLPVDDPNAAPQVSCGPPITGVDVQVLDTNDTPLPERTVGELAIKSNSMLTGYYHRDDLNPFTATGWYKTGDMGYMADGEVYVIGRSKDLIINAGKNIYPQDIEAIVNTVSGIHPGRAVVFGVPDEKEGTELIAIVAEVDADDADERRRISQQIRQQVVKQSMATASYVHLVERGWLIKTSSGKIARAANRDKWLAERGLTRA